MKKLKLLSLVLALLMVVGTGALAADEVEISGSLESDLVANLDNGNLTDTEKFNLILEKRFGFTADVYVDLEAKSFTLPSSKRETEVKIAEAYVNYYTKNMDWQLGKQKISWGSSYKLQPTNYFNPRDLTALKPMNEKVAVKAVKGTYYAPKRIEISGVVTPFFKTHQMSKEQKINLLNKFNNKVATMVSEIKGINSLQSDIKEKVINNPLDEVKDDVENTQAGFKVTKRGLKGFDVSATVYHGRDKLPIVDRDYLENQVNDLIRNYEEYVNQTNDPEGFATYCDSNNKTLDSFILYPETNQVGIDVIGDINGIGVWSEVAYSMYEDDQFDNRIQATLGADYKFENNLYLVGQVYYQQGRLDSEADIKAFNVHFDKPVFTFHTIEANAIYEAESETYLIEPQFTYSLANSTELQIGGTYKESNSDSQSSLISNLGDDRIYTRLKVEF
ncbi:hypothetical protein Halha_0602 [Halobacteroides halobius DSM 5150]|uniref:Porin n=1 Tax=Halobacteroides halobius (strain ATCC 35273 / DSM 5150 / MD-1) TaxID=748449 RepID=L0K6C2_HALHC|nr:DUF1302 family protein [Halobacteroides halobius]AGB40576.1 hypothetical protein Halha_0602 [Halobacteroides halobius DSM 5150]